MKIRHEKRKLNTRPRVTPHLGLWVGNWPASGTWHGSRGRVIGHLLNWARRFPASATSDYLHFTPSCFEVSQ